MKSFITATFLIAIASAGTASQQAWNAGRADRDAKALAEKCAKAQVTAKAECVKKFSVEAGAVTCKAKYTKDAIKATCAAQDPKVKTCTKD